MFALKKAIVIVVGGSGFLGRYLISNIKALDGKPYRIISVGHSPNSDADDNVVLSECTSDHYSSALSTLMRTISLEGSKPVSAVFCCAGGWQGGSSDISGGVSNKTPEVGSVFMQSIFQMWDKNVASASFAAALAPALTDGGLMVFVSSAASLNPTPSMIGYGMSKAAVNHLVQSLATEATNRAVHDSASSKTVIVSLLPDTLDTPSNRAAMPSADGLYPSWTPLDDVARRMVLWLTTPEARPTSGVLVMVKTKDGLTSFDEKKL